MKKPALYWALVLSILIGFRDAAAESAQSIYEKASKAVVTVVCLNSRSQMIGSGSGFFITENKVATNYHVVSLPECNWILLKLKDNDQVIHASVMDFNEENDVALLVTNDIESRYIIPLGDAEHVKTGEDIYVIGSPLGIENSLSTGIISNLHRKDNRIGLLQINAAISPGNSGGPVLNNRGEAVGMAKMTIKEGQNINFAVSISFLIDILKNNGIDYYTSGFGNQVIKMGTSEFAPSSGTFIPPARRIASNGFSHDLLVLLVVGLGIFVMIIPIFIIFKSKYGIRVIVRNQDGLIKARKEFSHGIARNKGITIGRNRNCAISLDDPYVSNIHAKIYKISNTCYIEDLGSKNGIFKGNTKIKKGVVDSGNAFHIGRYTIEIHDAGQKRPME